MSQRKKDRTQNRPEKEKTKGTHIDLLLQQTFKDDLPPDAEHAMKRRLDSFRRRMEKVETDHTHAGQKEHPGVSSLGVGRWVYFLLKKEVLVAVSVLMILLGGFIQSSGSPNKLTENMSVLGTSIVVSNQMSRSQSMTCSIQMSRENEKPLKYSIQWISPNLSKIQVTGPDNTLLKTIWLSEEDIIIADHTNDLLRKERRQTQLSDPLLRPIIGYLAPTELAERMYGEWQLERYQEQEECGQGIFKVALSNERAKLRVTVDLCTYLPVTIKKILPAEKPEEETLILDVRYTWDVLLSPELLLPPTTKERQEV